ncbi:uncharacterized protein N7483_011517 [Penicillium malachiteum]|uniref:uncharacterized protein n=1 Tax=Penicillium malachiteum TaxID=1324776 RepID=UPI002548567A|nr:uncharacterized protein N7483_011517 [Penicillium malachiteum]KAJ5714336.1 hypothetical protein N7483_011517 [Penicillium malachiteum]
MALEHLANLESASETRPRSKTLRLGKELRAQAAEGWMRRSATLDVDRTHNPPIPRSLDLDIIDGYERHYSWYSGRPKWIDAAG